MSIGQVTTDSQHIARHIKGFRQYVEKEFSEMNFWNDANMSFSDTYMKDGIYSFFLNSNYKDISIELIISLVVEKNENNSEKDSLVFLIGKSNISPSKSSKVSGALWREGAGNEEPVLSGKSENVNTNLFRTCLGHVASHLHRIDDLLHECRQKELDKEHFNRHILKLEKYIGENYLDSKFKFNVSRKDIDCHNCELLFSVSYKDTLIELTIYRSARNTPSIIA